MPRRVKRFGWVPDLPDPRDFLFAAPAATLQKLPTHTDLTKQCPAVYDQKQLGSCTANAIGGAFEFGQRKMKLVEFKPPSRLFIYYNERAMEGTVDQDSGARIRDGIKSVAKLGVCPETDWPYSEQMSTVTKQPDSRSYSDALANTVIAYHRIVQNLQQMKGCLAEGYPFVFGFVVYSSFESQEVARTGIVPMPDLSTEEQVGGHAVMAVGYDDATQRFKIRNSWGDGWGLKGYCTMPYAYLTDHDYSSDFWTIRGVKGKPAVASAAA